MNTLTSLVLIYLVALLWFGLRGERFTGSGLAFITSGGRAGVVLCALSLVSTIIGGSATLGMGALAQKTGAAAFWWLGVGAIGLFIHGLFIAPKIRAMQAATLPEVVGLVAGKMAERWAGIIIAVSWIAVTAAQFVALRALLGSMMNPLAAEVLYILIAMAVILHTVWGGQSAVLRTDAFQALLLVGGFSAVAFWLMFEHPLELGSLDWVPYGEHFGLYDWAKLMLLVGVTYVIGPDMFSRTFSARDGRVARAAALLAAPALVWFGIVITAMALVNIDSPQPIADWLTNASSMPMWLKGAIGLGLVSALCGSADTVLLSAAGIVERSLLAHDRTSAVRWMIAIFGALAALSVYVSKDIIGLLLTAYSFFVPGVAIPLLFVLIGPVKACNTQFWLSGAVIGGLCGLAGNLTGDASCTMAGMAIAALFALVARFRAPDDNVLTNKADRLFG